MNVKNFSSISTCVSLDAKSFLSSCIHTTYCTNNFILVSDFINWSSNITVNITFLHDLSTSWSKERLTIECSQNLQSANLEDSDIDKNVILSHRVGSDCFTRNKFKDFCFWNTLQFLIGYLVQISKHDKWMLRVPSCSFKVKVGTEW